MQLLRFCAVGAFNSVLDFSVYIGLTRFFSFWSRHIIIAASVSFILAVLSSFLLNNFWTFRRQRAEWRRGAKFFSVAAGGLAWNAGFLFMLTSFGAHDIAAKIIATGLVLAWNFTMQRRWTFGA